MSLYKNDILGYVKQAVKSILDQTFADFDFYIQYDGPVKEEVDEYLAEINDDRLKLYRRENNKGLACSLNELLDRVLNHGYDYIARMDADDMSMPERFENQLEYLKTHPDCDIVGTWAIEIKSDDSEFYKKQMPLSHEECWQFYMKRNPMIHPTVMFRKSYFEKAGYYPEHTFQEEDTMLWASGFANGCVFANIPEYLYRFRIDDQFFNRRKGLRFAVDTFNIRHQIRKKLGFPIVADIYALLFAASKIMPETILKILYKIAR